MTPDIEKLVSGGPEAVSLWIDRVKDGTEIVPAEFNWWLGLLYVLGSEARSEAEKHARLLWAPVALSAHDLVSNREDGDNAREVEQKAMYLRSVLIRATGGRSGDPVLDPQVVIQWMLEGLPALTDEIRGKLGRVDLSIPELRELRRIRQRLWPAEQLSPEMLDRAGQRLTDWLAVRERLP
jgi:hypothetical protein